MIVKSITGATTYQVSASGETTQNDPRQQGEGSSNRKSRKKKSPQPEVATEQENPDQSGGAVKPVALSSSEAWLASQCLDSDKLVEMLSHPAKPAPSPRSAFTKPSPNPSVVDEKKLNKAA